VEFLGEILALPLVLRSRGITFHLHCHFSQTSSPPPPETYTIGSDVVDLRRVVSTAHPYQGIAVYFSGIPRLYLVSINFFYRFFSRPQLLHEL